MSETGEAPKDSSSLGSQPDVSVVHPRSLESTSMNDILNRDTPLTIEEITKIRSEVTTHPLSHIRGRTYQVAEGTVGIWPNHPEPNVPNILEQMRSLGKLKESREAYTFERILVNALLEQLRISEKFALPKNVLMQDLKLEYLDTGTRLADARGIINVQVLAQHINTLKMQGATDEQIITELSGHLLHEEIHEANKPLKDTLLEGNSSFFEITTITAQLAYYLEKGYNGPTSYDIRKFKKGLQKIKDGQTSSAGDYDVATCSAATLIRRSLQKSYPTLAEETKDMDSYTACQTIVAKIPSEEKGKLIPSLKKAIAQSADPNEFQAIIRELTEDHPGKS